MNPLHTSTCPDKAWYSDSIGVEVLVAGWGTSFPWPALAPCASATSRGG
jgi:hypothetical protein